MAIRLADVADSVVLPTVNCPFHLSIMSTSSPVTLQYTDTATPAWQVTRVVSVMRVIETGRAKLAVRVETVNAAHLFAVHSDVSGHGPELLSWHENASHD